MFNDPIFRIALTVSLAAHLAFIVPARFAPRHERDLSTHRVDLNYIIIPSPKLAEDEESITFSAGHHGDEAPGAAAEEESILISPEDRESVGDTFPEEDAAGEKSEAYLKYYDLVREKIRSAVFNTVRGQGNGMLQVEFSIEPRGHVTEVRDLFSDLPPDMNREARRAILGSGPFPAFPAELGASPIVFTLDIRFASE